MIRLAPLALLLSTSALAAQPALPVPEAHETPEGRAFTLIPVAEADYVQVSLFWHGAAALEVPGKEGLLNLAPRLPFEEANGRRYEEIVEELTDAGANVMLLNSFTGTFALMQAQTPEGLAPGAEALNDVLTDAALAEDDLDWVRRDALDGLAEAERDPGGLMDRALTMLLADGDRRAAAITGRPAETLEAVTVEDVRAWLEASFDGAPVAVAAGPVTAEAAGAAIDAALEGLAERTAPPGPAPVVLRAEAVTAVIDAPEAETALVAVAFPVATTDVAATAAVDALAGSDEARLFRGLREAEGATYGVRYNYTPLTPELVSVALIASVPPDRAEKVLGTLRAEIARLLAEGLTADELAAARERIAAGEGAWLRDPATLASIAVDQAALGQPIDPAARREAPAMQDLAEINAALPEALPEGMVGVIVTPRPDLAEGDCTAHTPEELAGCETD